MKLIRKTLVGESESFDFVTLTERFLVKNFSGSDILVNFEDITNDNANYSIKIPAHTAQIVLDSEANGHKYSQIYVKGTGEVEVQGLI